MASQTEPRAGLHPGTPGIPWNLSQMPNPRAEEVSPASLGPHAGIVASSACVHAKSLQSCLTLCDPKDCSPTGSSVHGILHARILVWVAMPSFRGIFPTQGWNLRLLCLLPWQAASLLLAPPRKPMCPCKLMYLGPLKEQEPAQGQFHVAHQPHAESPGGKGWS